MLKVVSAELWNVLAVKGRRAASRRAAIAYVGESPPLSFGNGDLLVVDASDASIKSGRTSATALRRFYAAGAELFSHRNLHAKVIVLDDWAVIGSANDSQHSATAYVEAALVSDRPDLASQIERLITHLAKQSTLETHLGTACDAGSRRARPGYEEAAEGDRSSTPCLVC